MAVQGLSNYGLWSKSNLCQNFIHPVAILIILPTTVGQLTGAVLSAEDNAFEDFFLYRVSRMRDINSVTTKLQFILWNFQNSLIYTM